MTSSNISYPRGDGSILAFVRRSRRIHQSHRCSSWAPAHGSFSTRVLVEPPADQGDAEEAVASELSNRLAGIAGRGEPIPEKQAPEYAAFLDLISEHDVNLEVGVASSLRYRVRARVANGSIVAQLGGGIVAFKFGKSWRVQFPAS